MIPWYYAAVGSGVGALVGSVLMVIYYRICSAAAELLERNTAEGFEQLANWAQAKAKALKAPGK